MTPIASVRNTKSGRARLHALGDDLGGKPRARGGIRAGIGNLGFAEHAGIDADGGLERLRRRLAARAGHAHAIRADLLDLDIGDIEHDIRREIGGRIVDLVEHLLDHGLAVDAAAGAGGLGDRR